jgi:hypothetical protein
MLEMSIFFAIAGTIMLGGYYLLQVAPRRRRANAMRRAAASLGFDYLGDRDPFEGATGFSRQRLNLLWAHQADTFRNVLRGTTAAGPTLVFDHAYKQISEDAENDRVIHTVIACQLRGADLPQFTLEPYGLIMKVASVFGRQQIAFASHPRFSNDYELRGPDELAIRALFGPFLLDWWEALPAADAWAADGAGEWLLLYRHADLALGQAESPARLGELLREAEGLALAFQQHARASGLAPAGLATLAAS